MNAGYGKNSPKVLNLTRAPDEFHHKGTKDTKTDYLQKLTKVKLPDRPAELFRLGTSFPSMPSVKRLVFVFFVSPALVN
jgi:hypothetical protein